MNIIDYVGGGAVDVDICNPYAAIMAVESDEAIRV